jgi:hypothetical protein
MVIFIPRLRSASAASAATGFTVVDPLTRRTRPPAPPVVVLPPHAARTNSAAAKATDAQARVLIPVPPRSSFVDDALSPTPSSGVKGGAEESYDGRVGGGVEEVVNAYVAAWNATEPSERRRLLDDAVADDFVFAGPTGQFKGREAVGTFIAAMQERMPSTEVVRTGPATVAATFVEFGWEIRTSAGVRLLGGADWAETGDDGRLTRVEMKSMHA